MWLLLLSFGAFADRLFSQLARDAPPRPLSAVIPGPIPGALSYGSPAAASSIHETQYAFQGNPVHAAVLSPAGAGLLVLSGLAAVHASLRRRPRHLPPLLALREERLLLIDGNNLMYQRKVTKGREELAARLSGMNVDRCVLVFDGKPGEAASTSTGTDPVVVVTKGGEDGSGRVTADEWIEQEIEATTYGRVEVVTADRTLRAICHGQRVKTINPVKFWRRYLNRLKGLKNDYKNVPRDE